MSSIEYNTPSKVQKNKINKGKRGSQIQSHYSAKQQLPHDRYTASHHDNKSPFQDLKQALSNPQSVIRYHRNYNANSYNLNDKNRAKQQQLNQSVNNSAMMQNWMNQFLEQYEVQMSQKPRKKSNKGSNQRSSTTTTTNQRGSFQKVIGKGQDYNMKPGNRKQSNLNISLNKSQGNIVQQPAS